MQEQNSRVYGSKRYGWKRIETVLAVVLVVALPAAGGFLVRTVGNGLWPSVCEEGACRLLPGGYAWFLPGALLGFGFIPMVIYWMQSLYYRNRFNEPGRYRPFSPRDFEGSRLIRPFLLVFLVLAVLAGGLIRDNYLVITEGKVRIDAFTGLKERVYPLDQVRGIRWVYYERADDAEDGYYLLEFADGFRFSGRDQLIYFPEGWWRGAGIDLPIDTIRHSQLSGPAQ